MLKDCTVCQYADREERALREFEAQLRHDLAVERDWGKLNGVLVELRLVQDELGAVLRLWAAHMIYAHTGNEDEKNE